LRCPGRPARAPPLATPPILLKISLAGCFGHPYSETHLMMFSTFVRHCRNMISLYVLCSRMTLLARVGTANLQSTRLWNGHPGGNVLDLPESSASRIYTSTASCFGACQHLQLHIYTDFSSRVAKLKPQPGSLSDSGRHQRSSSEPLSPQSSCLSPAKQHHMPAEQSYKLEQHVLDVFGCTERVLKQKLMLTPLPSLLKTSYFLVMFLSISSLRSIVLLRQLVRLSHGASLTLEIRCFRRSWRPVTPGKVKKEPL